VSRWEKIAEIADGRRGQPCRSRIVCVLLVNSIFIILSVDYAREWQFGHKEVVEAVKSRFGEFDTVVVSTSLNEPHMFFLYYLKEDPAAYLAQGGTSSGKFDAG